LSDSISQINPLLTIDYIKNSRENQYFDRKSSRKDIKELTKHIIAFANASGGTLVIGVEDDGTITGFSKVGFQKIDQFKQIPLDYCKSMPIVKYEVIEIESNNSKDDLILAYHIFPSNKRVIRSTADEVFLRIGDQSRKLTHEQINNLEFDKGERYFEEEVLDRSSIEDLDVGLLGTYKKNINTILSDKEVLEGRGILVDGKLTVAGMLLFGKNPSKFYSNARLRFLRYEGIKAQIGQKINLVKDINIDGPIPKVIEQAKEIISAQIRDFQTLSKSGKFKTVPEYPEFAWLEGIVNALTHRDYSQKGEHIKVTMYDDRLEILSPGKLPNIVDLNNMRHTRYSRNPIIARILSELGWVKELNEGVKRIYEEMENYFLKEPQYSEPNGNAVLLRLDNNIIMRQIRSNEHMEKLFEKGIWDSLNEDERTIIFIAYREGKVTAKRVKEALNRSPGYCRNLLNNLKELEVFVWRGNSSNDPTQYYEFNSFT